MKSDRATPAPTLGAVFAAPFAIAAVLAVRGAVLAKLWTWFVVVPLDVPHLSWPHAMGLSLVASVLVPRGNDDSAKQLTAVRVLTLAVTSIILLTVCLAVAAVVAAVT